MQKNMTDRFASGENPLNLKQQAAANKWRAIGRRLAKGAGDQLGGLKDEVTKRIPGAANAAREAAGAVRDASTNAGAAAADAARKAADAVRNAGTTAAEGLRQKIDSTSGERRRARLAAKGAVDKGADVLGDAAKAARDAAGRGAETFREALRRTKGGNLGDAIKRGGAWSKFIPGGAAARAAARAAAAAVKVGATVGKNPLVRAGSFVVRGLRGAALPVALGEGIANTFEGIADGGNERIGDNIRNKYLGGVGKYSWLERTFSRGLGAAANTLSPPVRAWNALTGDTDSVFNDVNAPVQPSAQKPRPTPNAEANAPTSIDANGNPVFSPRQGGSTAQPGLGGSTAQRSTALDAAQSDRRELMGVDRNGTPMFYDGFDSTGAAAFSDRGLRGSGGGPSQSASVGERVASIDRQTQDLRDQRMAREYGFDDVQAYKQYELEQNIRGLRSAGLGDNALYAMAQQGGLRGGAGGAGGAFMDADAQLRLMNIQRQFSKDSDVGLRSDRTYDQKERQIAADSARDNVTQRRQMTNDELDLANYNRTGDVNNKAEFSRVVALLADPETREMGEGAATELLATDSPAARALVNYLIQQDDGTGWIDRILTPFKGAPKPENARDLRANFNIKGNELLRNDNNFVGRDYDEPTLRLLRQYMNRNR